MSPGGPAKRRRIVVTLDTGDLDTPELERLTRLAARLDAELEGVFVEDSDLLRLSGLTFLQEFRPTSGGIERVQTVRMQQELRVVARRAERSLSQYAKRQGVPWNFRVWRGSVERELLGAMEADVLALARLGAVLSPPRRRRRQEIITALFDGSEEAERALSTAAELAAEDDNISLQVLLAHQAGDEPGPLQEKARAVLADYPDEVVFHPLEDADLNDLVKLLHDSGSSALVMQRDNQWLRDAPLRQCLARLHCPLFLVR